MTRTEMHEELKRMHERTNWNSLADIKRYNREARALRQMVAEEEERREILAYIARKEKGAWA